MEIRNSPLLERLRDSAIISAISSIPVALQQALVGSEVTQILKSSGSEVGVCFVSSSVNLWLYNLMKKHGAKTGLTDNQIIFASLLLLSIFSVGCSRYAVHAYIGSKNPLHIATFFAAGNMVSSYAYEIIALQNNWINRISAKIRDAISEYNDR